MGEFSVWHLLVVALVFLALFGYKRLPDAARSIGRSMRIFKAEMHQMHDEEAAPSQPTANVSTAPAPSPALTAPPDTPPRPDPVTGTDAQRARDE
ncbi:MAG TPA: Sec-independent protein translocase subunit TatA [Mycobacteriales bacterium]|jgi:twin arginine-targeting protein translocase, TatA/E family